MCTKINQHFRMLCNKLHDLYRSPSIRVLKSVWTEDLVMMGETRDAVRILVGNLLGKIHLED
jgi:hypothetical protein